MAEIITLGVLFGVSQFAKRFTSTAVEAASKWNTTQTTIYYHNETVSYYAEEAEDPTAWILDGSAATFLLMKTQEIQWLCMLAYTFYHGCKLFPGLKDEQSLPYKFVRMIFQCTGGGLLVPIFINAIPVSLGNDAYPICIMISTLLHVYLPTLRNIAKLSPLIKSALIVLYETQRASVVVKLTTAASTAIPASNFSFPVFGPIFCGSIAGCGGAFLPLDKGLTPLEGGMADNMLSAFVAATAYHLFMNSPFSDDVHYAAKKAQIVVASYFILFTLVREVGLWGLLGIKKSKAQEPKIKKEKSN